MIRFTLALMFAFTCSQVYAQIGIGQCLWKSDGSKWVLIDCNCTDSSICSYPTGHRVPPAGVTQQFPADGPCTPRLVNFGPPLTFTQSVLALVGGVGTGLTIGYVLWLRNKGV